MIFAPKLATQSGPCGSCPHLARGDWHVYADLLTPWRARPLLLESTNLLLVIAPRDWLVAEDVKTLLGRVVNALKGEEGGGRGGGSLGEG